ncbi:PspC domain-containing protein [bacterium]|nr:PspC domain-containing protein [bacterium]
MKRIEHINLAGFAFKLDEDAALRLQQYLDGIKRAVADPFERQEVLSDVEARLVELFQEALGGKREVVDMADVEKAVGILGLPEDFQLRDEAAAPEQTASGNEPWEKGWKRLYRNPDDKIIGGVCGGIAAYFAIDPLWIRLAFAAGLFIGFGLPLYFILWIVMPMARTTAQKLEMRGYAATVANIRRFVQDEASIRARPDAGGPRPLDRPKNFLTEVFAFLGQLLQATVKAVGRILGWMLVAFGLFALLLFFAWISGSMYTDGGRISSEQVHTFLGIMSSDATQRWGVYLGLFLFLGVPALYALAVLIRTVLKLPKLDLRIRTGVFISFVAGILLTGLSASSWFASLQEEDRVVSVKNLNPEVRRWTLESSAMSTEADVRIEMNERDFSVLVEGDSVQLGWVELSIAASDDAQAVLRTTVEAHGYSEKNARDNARMLRYTPKVNDSTLFLPSHYTLAPGTPFRLQYVRHQLLLPQGTEVRIGTSMARLLAPIPNNSLLHEEEMAGHLWRVGAQGLECLDCAPEELDSDPFQTRGDASDSAEERAWEELRTIPERAPQSDQGERETSDARRNLLRNPITGLSMLKKIW